MDALVAKADDGALARVLVVPRLAAGLRDRWPPVGLRIVERGAPEGAFDLDIVVERARDLDRAESDLGLFAVAHLTHLVAVHAAMLVWEGAATLVPGVSFTGKSRLALAAAHAGIVVASDEYALVDPATGFAVGVPRPVRERRSQGVRRLAVATPTDPVAIGLVAALTWTHGKPQIHEIGPAEIVMALLANTVCAQTRPRESFEAAIAVAKSARGIGGRRGEAEQTLGVLLPTGRV